MSDTERRILLGRIAAAHGIRGDLLIETYTSEPGGIAAYGALQTEDGARELTLRIVRITPKGVIAHAKGVDDRNAAEALRGTTLYVERDSQKKIALGKGGQKIKEIGSLARTELEEMLERRVHLFLFVKVRENWQDDRQHLREWGLEWDV